MLHDDRHVETETRSEAFEHGASERRWLRPVAAVAMSVTALSGCGIDADRVQSVAADTAEAEDNEGNTSIPLTTEPAPSTIPKVESPQEGDAVGVEQELSPVLMSANDPRELLGQFGHNVECAFAEGSFESQQECLDHILGEETGNLTDLFQQRLEDANIYRATHPEYEFYFDIDYIDAKFSEQTAIIVARLSDPSGTANKRYTFAKTIASIERLSPEDDSVESWILQREETLEPGEVYFED